MLPGIKQFDLTGKSAVITGGSRGLGYAMAAGLASAGANLMLVNRNAEAGKIAAQQLTKEYETRIVGRRNKMLKNPLMGRFKTLKFYPAD